MTIIWSTISTRINVVGFVHPLILSNKLRKLQVLLFTVGRSRGFEFYPKNGWVNFGTIPGTMKPTHILRMTLPTVSGSLVLFTRNLRNISQVRSLLWGTDLICLRSYKPGRDRRGSHPSFFVVPFDWNFPLMTFAEHLPLGGVFLCSLISGVLYYVNSSCNL